MQIGRLQLKACKHGWMLFAGPYIGKCFDLYGEYSESEVAMMRRFLGPGSIAIDVGANIGALTVPLSKLVTDSGRVYAIESHAETYNVLCANLALNRILNTKPTNAFIGSTCDVSTDGGAWGANAYIGDVWKPPIIPLDSLDLSRCDLIKIDVDGKERDVLESGAMLIEKHRPVLYFENDQRAASPPLLDLAKTALGYDLYWHIAPIVDVDNYYGNTVNHWAPNNIASVMVLGIPAERNVRLPELRKILSSDDWWQNEA